MQTLRDEHGAPAVLRALRFMSIRLKSRPETIDLAQDVATIREALVKFDERWLEAREQRVAATAEVTYLDTLVGDAVRDLARRVATVTGGNADDSRSQKLFPVSPSVGTRGIGDSQTVFVRSIISRLETESDLQELKPFAQTLQTKLEALLSCIERRNALYVPEAQAQGDRRVAVDEAKRVYNLAHARLQLLFPKDRALVESFFATIGPSGSPRREAEEETVSPDAVPV